MNVRWVFDGLVKTLNHVLDFLIGGIPVGFRATFIVAAAEESKEASLVVLDQLRSGAIAEFADVPDLKCRVGLPDPSDEMLIKLGMDFHNLRLLRRVGIVIVLGRGCGGRRGSFCRA